MTEAIILVVDDLMFLPRLEGTITGLGYQPLPAANQTQLSETLQMSPVLIILDLSSRSFDWETLLTFIKNPVGKAKHVPVLGFGPHVDLDLRERALLAGCDAVVGRSAVANQLPQLIKKYRCQPDS